jgi:hypothetical protein
MGIEHRVAKLETARSETGAPREFWVWEESPIPAEAEDGNCVVHIIRWLRPDEAPADPAARMDRHGHA